MIAGSGKSRNKEEARENGGRQVPDRTQRLALLNGEWQRLLAVIDTRAAEAQAYRDLHGEDEGPGMSSGLLVKRSEVTGKRHPVMTTTYTLDCRTLRELRALERQAIKELLPSRERRATTEQDPILLPATEEQPASLTMWCSPAVVQRRQTRKAA